MIKKADRDAILAMLEDPMVRYKEPLVQLVNALPCEAGTEVPVEEERSSYPDIEPIPRAPSVTLTKEQAEQLRHNSGHLASAEPDFPAMARRYVDLFGPDMATPMQPMLHIDRNILANSLAGFLRAHWPKPAPAVPRDEAWWTETMLKLWASIGDGVDAFERVLRARFAAAPAPAVVQDYPDIEAAKMQIGTALVNAQACRELWDNKQDHSLTFREGLNAVVSACVHATDNLDRLKRTFAAAPAFDVEAMARRISDRARNSEARSWVRDTVIDVAREMGLGKGGA
jgi:hypothetical protein